MRAFWEEAGDVHAGADAAAPQNAAKAVDWKLSFFFLFPVFLACELPLASTGFHFPKRGRLPGLGHSELGESNEAARLKTRKLVNLSCHMDSGWLKK